MYSAKSYQFKLKLLWKNLKLLKIAKYSDINFNINNFGGLVCGKFPIDMKMQKYDEGKLTHGKVVQLFKKATELDTEYIKSVIDFTFPDMEWHHAGKLPKQYGGEG